MLHIPSDVQPEHGGERRARPAPGPDPRAMAAATLSAAVAAVRRRKFPLILCAVAIPTITFLALQQVTPRYTALGSVVYEPSSYQAQELQSILRVDPMSDAVMASQAEIVKSLATAERLVDKYNLMQRPEFNWTLQPPSLLARTIDTLRLGLHDGLEYVSPTAAAWFDAPPVETPDPTAVRQSVVAAVQDAIKAEPLRASHVLQVSFTSQDPGLAADAANGAMDLYITDQLAAKFDAIRRANDWLQQRVQELRTEVQTGEDKIAAYRAKMGLVQGVQAGLDTEQVSRLSADLVQAKNDLAQSESRLDAARGRSGQGAAAQAAVSASVVTMRIQQDTLNAQLQSLLTRLGPNHPDVVSLRNQLAELQRAVGGEIGRVVAAAEADVRANRAKVNALEANLKQFQGQIDKQAQAQIPLNAMQREVDASRNLLQAVLARIQTTAQQNAIEQPDARVISAALVPPEPSFPKTKLLLAASVVFGVLFGLLVVYLLEVSDSTFRSGDDVRTALGLPCFALVPQIRARILGRIRMEDYVVRKPLSPFTEQIRALRAGLWLDQVHPKVVAITAARPAEAKTTTAISLGRSGAINGEKVIVLIATCASRASAA